jgi:ankyrin repeat protein
MIIERLIKTGINVNETDEKGNTPIFYANRADIIELLLQFGADKSVINNIGKTAYDCGEERSLPIACLKLLSTRNPMLRKFTITSSYLTEKYLIDLLKKLGCDDAVISSE